MKLIGLIVICCSILAGNCLPDVADLIRAQNYVAETHEITTEDGYILTVYRIPYGINGDNGTLRVPVLLNHGLAVSAADFINAGPEKGLGFILADQGYDVWMMNCRGNSYSQKHTNASIDPFWNPKDFYDFSWHEIGYYDLPATIDYILEKTNQVNLHYIGHSQGGTTFYVMASTRPEYNSKIRLATLLAGSGIFQHVDILVQLVSHFIYELEVLANTIQLYNIPLTELLRDILHSFCEVEDNSSICVLIFAICGSGYADVPQINSTLLPIIFRTSPSTASIKQALHYGQLVKSGEFCQYDFGTEENLIRYGTEKPPAYDFSKINAPLALFYGKNDMLVNYLDVEYMASLTPNVVKNYLIPYELFSHSDHIYAKDVVDLLYEEVLDTMSKFK